MGSHNSSNGIFDWIPSVICGTGIGYVIGFIIAIVAMFLFVRLI